MTVVSVRKKKRETFTKDGGLQQWELLFRIDIYETGKRREETERAHTHTRTFIRGRLPSDDMCWEWSEERREEK